jgi:hypothetical protein
MPTKIPKAAFECLATQLILRSVGFVTPEFSVEFIKKGKLNTDISLSVQRDDQLAVIELGSIKLAHKTVLQHWENWLTTATEDLVKDFKKDKKLFYDSFAYKTMNALLETLETKGFELADTQISATFKR